MTILDRAIHFCAVIDLRSLVVLLLGLVNEVVFLLAIRSFDGHANITHINF